MITVVNNTNNELYKALFEEAADILSGYQRVRTYDATETYYQKNYDATSADDVFLLDENIVSLATFTQALRDREGNVYTKKGEAAEGFEPLVGITTLEEYFSWLKVLGNTDKKYTVLPLDEEHFEINANTRAINIPASFKKNGVAVQGDDLAEVLYFKIDRYFDFMDLNNTEILIQWETPKGADGTTIKSVSPAYHRDITSEPGKLIFGWALSDAITANPGTLKFSVRFFQWGKPGEAGVEEGQEKVLLYSFGTLTASVTIQPSIVLDIENEDYVIDDAGERLIQRLKDSDIVGGYVASKPTFIVDLDDTHEYDLDEITEEYELIVQAQSGDTGAISYKWYRRPLNEENEIIDGQVVLEGKNTFEPADMENLDATRTYYFMVDDKPQLYRGPIPMEPNWEERYGTLYEKCSAFTADRAAVYYAVAENRMTNSSQTTNSASVKFPRPNRATIVTPVAAKGILENEEPVELFVIADNAGLGKLSYQWVMDPNHAANFDGETTNFVPIEGATEATYEASAPGHYKVIITNTRNKETIDIASTWARVTNAPEIPTLTYEDNESRDFRYEQLVEGEVIPKVRVADPVVEHDEFVASWFEIKDVNGVETPSAVVENVPVEKDVNGNYVATFNPLDYPEYFNGEEVDGEYYCVITNRLNGREVDTKEVSSKELFRVREYVITENEED